MGKHQSPFPTFPLPLVVLGDLHSEHPASAVLVQVIQGCQGHSSLQPVTLHPEGWSNRDSDTALHSRADSQEHPQRKWSVTQQPGPNQSRRLFLSPRDLQLGPRQLQGILSSELISLQSPTGALSSPDLPEPSPGNWKSRSGQIDTFFILPSPLGKLITHQTIPNG